MLTIALVCKYVAHMGHRPSGSSKNKLTYQLYQIYLNKGSCRGLNDGDTCTFNIHRWLR